MMKTEITPQEYINIYLACGWDPKAFSIVLKRLGYSDELIVKGHLWLGSTPIKSLVNVKQVKGSLYLGDTPISDLGNLQKVWRWLNLEDTPIQDLGKLEKVGIYLDLRGTSIQDFGNLKVVDGDLWLEDTPISEKYSEKEIKKMVIVNGSIYI